MSTEATAPEDTRLVKLVSKDGESFEVPVAIASISELVKSMIQGDDSGEIQEVTLIEIQTSTLAKVIEFCNHYKIEPMTPIEKPLKSTVMTELVQEWYANFIAFDKIESVFELLLAANFMDIRPMLDLCGAAIMTQVKGLKTPEEIKDLFGVVNERIPRDEKDVRRENPWVDQA